MGLNVIRTVWLGVIFLVILAGVGSFRFAFGHFDVADASGIVRPDGDGGAGAKTVQKPLTSADRSPAAFASPPHEFNMANASNAPIEPAFRAVRAIEMPHIVSRHWHDPDSPAHRQVSDTRSKRKHNKGDAINGKSQVTAEPKDCQLAGFDAIRWALNLPTGCRT